MEKYRFFDGKVAIFDFLPYSSRIIADSKWFVIHCSGFAIIT